MNWPEHLGTFITIAWELYVDKENGAAWGRDELSAGEGACLNGITQGFNRATNERYEQTKKKAQQQPIGQGR